MRRLSFASLKPPSAVVRGRAPELPHPPCSSVKVQALVPATAPAVGSPIPSDPLVPNHTRFLSFSPASHLGVVGDIKVNPAPPGPSGSPVKVVLMKAFKRPR